MKIVRYFVLLCLASVVSFAFATAQEKAAAKMDMPSGVRGSFAKQSKFVEGQLTSLAQAIPQEKYNWRPGEGVRSIAESFLHAAGGNYVTLTTMGGQLPAGVDMKTLEKSTTDKAKIADALKQSFAAVNDYISKIPEADYGKHVSFFGNDMTILDMIFLAATHQHETLGQAIAYARSNGVTPPWTAERQAQMKEKEKEGAKKN